MRATGRVDWAVVAERDPPLQTSRRDIFLLACCQALLLVNASGLISMNGLVGFSLAETKALATFGATTYVAGSALAAMPMSLWMGRVGRRVGFMAGAAINIAGCGMAALALQRESFPLFCIATGIIGIYNAVGLQYRFAAAEVAAAQHKAMAISLVLAGGVVGGLIGPQTARFGRDLFATPFLGSFVLLAAFALVALAVQSQVHVPRPSLDERTGTGRPLARIARQPAFVVAVVPARSRLRPDEPADDGDADRDGLLRASVQRGGVGHRMARRRDVPARVLHRRADPPFRNAFGAA